MSDTSAGIMSFAITTPTVSGGPVIQVELPSPQIIKLDLKTLEALEDFQDVTDAHKAFTDPRNRTARPWSKVKRSLKL
jgi:hypothetical protein